MNLYPDAALRYVNDSGRIRTPASRATALQALRHLQAVNPRRELHQFDHELVDIPAPVRFLSCEPLLGHVAIPWRYLNCDCDSSTGIDQSEAADKVWRCDSCSELWRYVDDPDGRITLETIPRTTVRRVRKEVVKRGRLIDWVIVGGESGPGHRPLVLDHARAVIAQCDEEGVPVFFKQVGGRTPTAGGDRIDGRMWKQFPMPAVPS